MTSSTDCPRLHQSSELVRVEGKYQSFGQTRCFHPQPLRCKEYVSPKRCYVPPSLHGVITQNNFVIKRESKWSLCSQGGEYELYCLLECYVVKCRREWPTFQRCLLSHSNNDGGWWRQLTPLKWWSISIRMYAGTPQMTVIFKRLLADWIVLIKKTFYNIDVDWNKVFAWNL